MWRQNRLGFWGVFTVLLWFTPLILGQTIKRSIRDKDTPVSFSSTTCVLNTRKPSPLNPRTFLHCTANGSTLMKCPEEMVFDAASSDCIKDDAPLSDQYAPNCARAINGAFFPSYTYCSHFWRCNFQRAVLFVCKDDTYWSQEDLACVYPKDANCHLMEDDERNEMELNRNWKRPTLQQMRRVGKFIGNY